MTMTISREAMDALQQTATTWATAREWSGDCVEELRAILDRCTVVEPPAASAEAQTEYVLMPRKFTAENGAKHALIGELYETFEAPCIDCSDEDCELCNGAGFVTHRLEISWSVMKEIYNKAVEVLSIPCPPASSSTPALREVTDEDVRIAGKAYNKTGNKPTVGTHEEGIRAALESFRARLSTAQGDAWRCEQCGELADPMSSRWRWNGEEWQHHHDIVGHVRSRNFGSPSSPEAP